MHILNPTVYAQEAFEIPHLHLDAGLRLDTFRFALTDRLNSANTGVMTATAAEPKLNLVYRPSAQLPLALHFNFGRAVTSHAVTSQDARGMALDPHAPRAAATNFYSARFLDSTSTARRTPWAMPASRPMAGAASLRLCAIGTSAIICW